MVEAYRPNEGVIELEDVIFKLKPKVTSAQFQPVKQLKEEMDKLERRGDVERLPEEEINRMETNWYNLVISAGLENETLDSVRNKLSEGALRTLVALTYHFLWMFGSIVGAKQYWESLGKTTSQQEKSSQSIQT